MIRFRSALAGAIAAIVGTSLAPRSAHAVSAAELEALRDEIRQEREALADERRALEDQRRRMDDAIARLEERQSADELPAVSAGNAEDSGVRLDIYGFVHTDAIYDFNRVDPDWKATLRPSRIPINCQGGNGQATDPGCGNDGETVLSVRQSRLGFRGWVPTQVGEIKTLFEFELFGVGDDAGETTFRLRHAYGELGPFGAGQTWSLFMDPDVFPNTVDYWGPVGMVFFRNPQIRYTPLDNENWRAALAIESPGSALDQGRLDATDLSPFGEGFSNWDRFPDVTAQIRHRGDWGHVQLAGIVRSLGFEIRSNDGGDPDGSELGYAANLSGSLRLFENDAILWQVVGGRGFAGYMNDGGVDLAPNGDLDEARSVPGLGWLLYYNRQWAERWTSSIGFSEHRQFNTKGQTDSAFETGQYGNVNLLFHPVPQMYVGPEFVWGRRENNDGKSGDDSRLQVSFHYKFGGTVLGQPD